MFFRARFVLNMDCDSVRERLASELGNPPSLFSYVSCPDGVVGNLKGDKFVAFFHTSGFRDFWRDIFYGKIVPSSEGCQIIGYFAWHKFVMLFSAIWLAVSLLPFMSIFYHAVAFHTYKELLDVIYLPVTSLIFFLLINPFWPFRKRAREKVIEFIQEVFSGSLIREEVNI